MYLKTYLIIYLLLYGKSHPTSLTEYHFTQKYTDYGSKTCTEMNQFGFSKLSFTNVMKFPPLSGFISHC